MIVVLCIQVTYIGNTTVKHGNHYGKAPTGTMVLAGGDQISSTFGNADKLVRSIGFTTISGAVFGPWGENNTGSDYIFPGPVYGFYGGLWGDVLGSLGTWTIYPHSLSTDLHDLAEGRKTLGRGVLSTDSTPQLTAPWPSYPSPASLWPPSRRTSLPISSIPMLSPPSTHMGAIPKALQSPRFGSAGAGQFSDGPNFSGAPCCIPTKVEENRSATR
jgi:hypothetical protein